MWFFTWWFGGIGQLGLPEFTKYIFIFLISWDDWLIRAKSILIKELRPCPVWLGWLLSHTPKGGYIPFPVKVHAWAALSPR